jgi:hypothetical protein
MSKFSVFQVVDSGELLDRFDVTHPTSIQKDNDIDAARRI